MASNVVSLLSSDEDEQNLDDTMVVSIPTPCLSNKTAQKRSALEAAKVASTTSAVMAGNTAISKHVSACIQSPKWGQRFSSTIHDPFLVSSLPTTTTTTKITATNISWEDLRLKLTDSDFIVLSAHALKKYEEMKFTSIPSPRKKSKVANKSTEKGNIYDRLENLVDAIHALARRTVSSSIKESVKPIPSSNNTNTPSYWKSGTGYGGGNTKGANDMKQAFTLQTKAHQRQATEDSSSKLLLDKALQQLKGCENDLLLHPVTSGAILRYFVPQCANYLSTSFDDICEREHLFTSVLSIISFFKKNPYYQHILHVPPDETSGKNKLEEEDNSPPPPSIEQLLSTLNRQASMFAVTLGSNKQSKEAKACMRLTTSIQACIGSSSSSSGNGNGRRRGGRDANNKNNKQSLADVVGSNGGPSSMSVDPVDLTSRSGQQIDSYVAVMNTMKIKTEKLLNGSKFSYHYRAQAQNVKSSQPKRLIRIGKELASLSNSLPIHDTSSVFVCIDEERPDCLKALIVGPAGTPYENGLFEFDIFLPSNYPNVPPKVILVTTGGGQIRFNPNLYAEGKVCLSLLGTWAGPGWHPNCTLLQVLISIQSLILVDEPFFNEPGFEKYQGTEAGAHASAVYNHRIREATIKYAMIPHLKKTSTSPFSDIIREHFGRRSLALRAQCEKWCKQLRRHGRTGSKSGMRFHVQVFAGGVQNSTPSSLSSSSSLLYSHVDQLVAERSASKQKARENAASGSSSSSSSSSSSNNNNNNKSNRSKRKSKSSSSSSNKSSSDDPIILID